MRTRLAAALLVGIVGALAAPAAAHAHTELDFSLPTDGATVGEAVSEITVGFTEAVTLVGPGFEVLDPQGNIVIPFAVTDDDKVFRLQLDPPLGGGDVGVRYEVTSADGHVVTGSFSFTVTAPAPTTTTTPPTTTPPPTPPSTTPTTAPPTTNAPTTNASTTSRPTTDASVPTSTADGTDDDDDDDDSDSTWVYLAIAGAVVVAAGAFLILRPKPSG